MQIDTVVMKRVVTLPIAGVVHLFLVVFHGVQRCEAFVLLHTTRHAACEHRRATGWFESLVSPDVSGTNPPMTHTIGFVRPIRFSQSVTIVCAKRGGTNDGNAVDRLARVVQSNVNKVISNRETPEEGMVRAIQEIQSELDRIRPIYAETKTAHDALRVRHDEAAKSADVWYQRAQLALARNNEGLARQALVLRHTELESQTGWQAQLELSHQGLDTLRLAVTRLESQLHYAQTQRQQWMVRARAAEATAQIQAVVSAVEVTSSATGKCSRALDRMEQKVQALEDAADRSAVGSESVLEAEFQRLEQSSRVEVELEALRLCAPTNQSKSTKALPDGTDKIVVPPMRVIAIDSILGSMEH